MYKKINGRVIDIENMETFLRAYEGLQKVSNLASQVEFIFSDEFQKKANEIIQIYQQYHEGLPFPLVAVEDSIKYVTIGHLIQEATGEKLYLAKQGLLFPMDNNTALKLQSSFWAIVDLEDEDFEKEFSLLEYGNDDSFNEFAWVYHSFKEYGNCEEYYSKFLPDFLEACLNEEMIIKFELDNILNFGYLPERKEIENNTLVYLDDIPEKTYRISFIERGFRKVKEKNNWFYDKGKLKDIESNQPLYDLEVQTTDIKDKKDDIKAKLTSFYSHLLGTLGKDTKVQNVSGVIVNGIVVYRLKDFVYAVPFSKELTNPKQIAYGAKLLTFEDTSVYLEKDIVIDSEIIKRQVYSYNVLTNETKLVRISFHKLGGKQNE